MELILQVAAVIIALGGAGAVIGKYIVKPLHRIHAGLSDFLEDWNGRPDRPGVPGHRGAMERLEQLENNGGSSMKDTVEKTAVDLGRLRIQVTEHLDHSRREREAGKRIEAELRSAIGNLSEAVKVAALSAPPERE